MKSVLIWDLPTRLFHWLLAAGCTAAFALALAAPEHSRAFDSHMLFGLTLVPLLAFRLFWGVAGSRYARFRSFLYRPAAAVDYLVSMVSHTSRRYLGHNPAAGYAILALLVLVAGCVASGLLISSSEFFKELHEVVSYVLLGVIGAHLLGVLVHTLVHRENVVLSMLTGKKKALEEEGIAATHSLGALFLLLLMGTWTAVVINNYDFTTRKLHVPLIGTTMQLGTSEQNREGEEQDDD